VKLTRIKKKCDLKNIIIYTVSYTLILFALSLIEGDIAHKEGVINCKSSRNVSLCSVLSIKTVNATTDIFSNIPDLAEIAEKESDCLSVEKYPSTKEERSSYILSINTLGDQKLNITPLSTSERKKSLKKNWWDYPPNILQSPQHGDDLLVIVNKHYKLLSNYTPKDLVSLSGSGMIFSSGKIGRKIIINPLKEMNIAAKKDGVELVITSAYRSYDTQRGTYNYWVAKKGGDTDAADKFSARAGHSQHQLGTTIDFSSPESNYKIGSVFNRTRAARWLEDNAWKYGFVIVYPEGEESVTGYNYEGWHYRFIGKESAKKWHESGEVLDVWLLQVWLEG